MNCPFLREDHVRSCRRAAFRKMIPQRMEAAGEGRCLSPDYVHCPVYVESGDATPLGPQCPLLDSSLVQFCAASTLRQFIPYSEASISRCGSGAFRYCDLYLEWAGASSAEAPHGLYYTPNHMWVDIPEDGLCHIGIDWFLARMFGQVDHIGYLTVRGETRPAVVLSSQGADYQLVFPESIEITGANNYLRANPDRLTREPYTQGWLFEANADANKRAMLRKTLRPGTAAQAWIDEETRRVNERVQALSPGTAADGGMFVSGLLSELNREQAAAMFYEFCSPWAGPAHGSGQEGK